MGVNTVYLITGGARGLGKGLVETYLARPNNTVIAAVRDVDNANAKALQSLPVGNASQLIIVKIDSKFHTDPHDAVELLKSTHKISHLDVVIANAGISYDFEPVDSVDIGVLQDHVTVNGFAPVILFQAVFPLLKEATNPKYIIIGSALGSIGGMEARAQYPAFAYGASKALAHFTARRIHFTHENIISVLLDPGFPQTDMGNSGARRFGMEKAFTEVDECVGKMVGIVDNATRLETSGRYMVWDGSDFPW